MKAPGRESTVGRVLVMLGLFALASCVRALTWQDVLAGERVFLHGNDAYYHLRRIAWSVANFPSVLGFDPYINFPDGAPPIWTPVFDWLIAWGALPFAREAVLAGELQPLERIAVWLPPLLGACTVVVLHGILWRGFGRGTASAAALVLCVMSGHAWYSQVGFVDHHVAVALVATVLLGCGMNLLAAPGRLSVVSTGAAAALALTLWPGMLLHVALLEAAVLVDCVGPLEARPAVERARRFAALNGLALVLVLPLCLTSEFWQSARFSPVVLSAFQPWLFAVLASLGLACAALFPRGLARGRGRRAAIVVLLGLALLGASLVALPGLRAGAAEAWGWLSKSDPFQAQVKESMPLIVTEGGRPSFGFAAGSLSLFFFAVPIALIAFVRWARRQPNPAPFLFVAGFTFALCCASLLQRRFVNSTSIAISLLFGWSAIRSYAWLARGASARRRGAAALVVTAVALGALAPVLAVYRHRASDLLGFRGGKSAPLLSPEVRRRITLETGEWLRANTPDAGDWLGASELPSYGVLAPWYLGHPLGYASRRPMVSNNFGNDIGERNFRLAQSYFTMDEASAAALLESLRVRYVVVDWHAGEAGAAPSPDSMIAALYLRNGNPFVGEDGRDVVPALRRHRLIYESPSLSRRDPKSPPYLKVFELVEGARVVGRASPGATVTATLDMRSNRQRAFEYRNRVVAEADGHYRMVLPYSNAGHPPGMRLAARYSIDCGDEVAPLVVEEADVSTGAEVAGPDLCLSQAGG